MRTITQYSGIETRPVVSILNPESLGAWMNGRKLAAPASATWFAANGAIYIPFRITRPTAVRKLWWSNGATAAGNVDVGIYDEAGNRIVSTGSTAQVGTNTPQSVTVTETWLRPGHYFIGVAASSTSTTFTQTATLSGANFDLKSLGIYKQTAAFPLPATATFATNDLLTFPLAGFSVYTAALP